MLKDRKRRSGIRNIALSGGYGTGKSSVLAAVEVALRRRVVSISLSSLGEGVPATAGPVLGSELQRPELDQEKEQETNNLIQKEIVKQLLYRERPASVPGSRFRRIGRIPRLRVIVFSSAAALVTAAIFWLLGWDEEVANARNVEALRYWLLLGPAALALLLSIGVQWLLHNRVRVDKVGNASASVTLKVDDETSFFDKYLDEIVYFFEITKRDVVLIEDLDRFENPSIYESLRALNAVLNTSNQLRKRPVHFIYAVRDSIFEDLEPPARPPSLKAKPVSDTLDAFSVAAPSVWQADHSLSDSATQRTKFFDLVIPIVPFITHRTSRDLLTRVMKDVDERVPASVLAVVGRHVTDMRLLLNIVNEFRVFRERVLAPGKVSGLTAHGLFALIVYKNTRLEDFELMRVGQSSLDKLYRASRLLIDEALGAVSREISTLEDGQQPLVETEARAAELGAELQALAVRWLPRLTSPAVLADFRVDGTPVPTADIAAPAFWAGVIDAGKVIEVWSSLGSEAFRLTAKDLRAELGPVVPDSWAGTEDVDLRVQIDALRAQQAWLRSADFKDLTKPVRQLMQGDRVVDFTRELLRPLNDPLLADLIAEGSLDRNFALYASEFHGDVTSANAMTFLVQHVQGELPSPRFPLSETEIDSVVAEGGAEVFGSVGLYNLAIYDLLLSRKDDRLVRNIAMLSWRREIDEGFVDLYLEEGAEREAFLRHLAAHWSVVFEYVGQKFEVGELRDSLLLAAFEGIDPQREYGVTAPVKDELALLAASSPELTDPVRSPERAVTALRRLGLRISDLSALSTAARSEVVATRQFVVTADNLRLTLGSADIGLDAILSSDIALFDHVVLHLDEYLAAIDGEKPKRKSLTMSDSLVPVMVAIEASEPGRSVEVAQRLPVDVRVEVVDDVPDDVLGVLARSGRFVLDVHNLEVYLSKRTLDGEIVEYLESARFIDSAGHEAEYLVTLAQQLVNESRISVDARIDLLRSLKQERLPISTVTSREPELIGALVDVQILDEDAATYNALRRSHASQMAFIVSSRDPAAYFSQINLNEIVATELLAQEWATKEIVQLVADQVVSHPEIATPEVLATLAASAKRTHAILGFEFAAAAMSSAADDKLKLEILDLCATELAREAVEANLMLLPDPYPHLTQRSMAPVDIPATPDPTNLLKRLEDSGLGPVSSWEILGDRVRVRMRHPQGV